MSSSIAIVGMACRYPDARSPRELWENVLAQRQAFRRIPRERMSIDDYCSSDEGSLDRSYSTLAAVITGWEFDRAKFRVSRRTYETADVSHWLALDVASTALDDAMAHGATIEPESCGVAVGNTLTGDATRATSLRLRWPYVRRVIESSLETEGWSADHRAQWLEQVERRFKSPFPEVGEETLAGALSNTIAGRICNHYGFGGSGFTVDGACASSLLAVTQACTMLVERDLDVALAGGVDVSLDPFELVGFAKTQALARNRMWVFDERSGGFLPGEGCGFVVLMREEDALRSGVKVYATIRGWGISSDGEGGITRPEIEGQKRALERAYRRAGVAPSSVGYFEAHGTGTAVGDAVEVAALQSMLERGVAPIAIGSVKGNIGHTKAAAGIAGLLKATLAVHRGTIPPVTACEQPRRDLARLRVVRSAEPWTSTPRRAGVSAFGFGGLNAHVVIESDVATDDCASQDMKAQDAELFLLAAPDAAALEEKVRWLAGVAETMSFAELTDLAVQLAGEVGDGPVRAAVVASSPSELHAAAAGLISHLPRESPPQAPKVVLLFSGQAAPVRRDAGAWGRRFAEWDLAGLFAFDARATGTAAAQPAIVASSIAALRFLSAVNLAPSAAIGHSLGELTALHWGGAIDETDLLRLAAARGTIMERFAEGGAMAAIAAAYDRVTPFLRGGVVIAAFNAADQTIVSGPAEAVAEVCSAARSEGLVATVLPVAAAFHSPMMGGAAAPLREAIASCRWKPLTRPVISTVTGRPLENADIASLLTDQLTNPVRFLEAITAADADLFIEVGPGTLLADLAARITGKPAVSLDGASNSLRGLLETAALLFTRVPGVNLDILFRDRFARPFDPSPRFIGNACESVADHATPAPAVRATEAPAHTISADADEPTELVVRRLISRRSELPIEQITSGHRLLADLHLNSISVSRLVAEAARALGVAPVADPMQFAAATVGEIARALDELRSTSGGREVAAADRFIPGIDDWVRTFVPVRVPSPIGRARASAEPAEWVVIPDDAALRERFAETPGRGVVAVVPNDDPAAVLLEVARRAPRNGRVIFVQKRSVASGFARTLFLERADLSVSVVEAPVPNVDHLIAEARACNGFTHAYYDGDGARFEERFRLQQFAPARFWSSDDHLLVTGGGTGIAAETALQIARKNGIRVTLVGRRDPANDGELAASLERFRGAGVRLRYATADVTDPASIRRALANAGPITAILHGAGTNTPRLIDSLDETAFEQTAAPKVAGFENVVAALDARSMRLVIAFGSVIARTGMRGEADYAFANEWLARAVDDFAARYPHCRAMTIESSVWSGAGMGERLGRVEALRREGIAALTVDEAVAMIDHLACSDASGRVLLAGRIGDPPTIRFDAPALPLARFLEQVRVAHHGIEIVADSRLSSESDPYLDGHVFRGEPLLPAVVGIEAMLEAAAATIGCDAGSLSLDDVALERPIVVPDGGTTLRVATLARSNGVEVVLRSSETGFAADHFRAVCRPVAHPSPSPLRVPDEQVALDADQLYGTLLFQRPPFQRVRRYLRLSSTECVAEIAIEKHAWFGRYLPASLAGGDAGARDAAIHAIQACIPQATVLPYAIKSIERWLPLPENGSVFVFARERVRQNGQFIYDVDLVSGGGTFLERWKGLALRAVERRSIAALPPALWGPFLERELSPLLGDSIHIAATPDRTASTASETRRVAGVRAFRRGDGKPVAGDLQISASRAHDVRLTATSVRPVAVDVQGISPQPWDQLLDSSQIAVAQTIASERSEPFSVAATRVWGAVECIKKLGGRAGTPLAVRGAHDSFVRFSSGRRDLASTILETPDRMQVVVTVANAS